MEIKVLHQVMEWNEDVSAEVRKTLSEKKVCLINVMGSPGAGKTRPDHGIDCKAAGIVLYRRD